MTKRKKLMIEIAVFVAVLMGFYMLVYEPKQKEVLRLQQEIKTVDLQIERIVIAMPGLRQLEAEVAREQERISLFKKTGEQPIQELLRQLGREAYRLDMDVISLRPQEASESLHEKSGYKRLTMVMNIQCPYRHLGSYLKELGNLRGLVIVDGLEIVKNDRIFPRIQAKLTLSTFVSR